MKKLTIPKEKRLKVLVAVLLLSAVVGVILFVPPAAPPVVTLFIILISLFTYVTSQLFISKKNSVLVLAFSLMFLTIAYLIGFQIETFVLLLSFIIGIAILIR